MRILNALRSVADVSDPAHPLLATGTTDEQRQKRLEWRRAKDAQGIIERWDEIPSERLVFSRYWIEDTKTGNLYREFHGDPGYARTVAAYYLRDGWPVMLEPHDPPSRAVMERRRAAREQRRDDQAAAAKARYDALRMQRARR